MLAGVMANWIFYMGAKLPDFQLELFGMVSVMIFIILGPLLVFVPRLSAAKRVGLREYGRLAQRYTGEFDRKWLRGGAPANEPLIGSADIQSLADMNSSFEVIHEIRVVPITWQSVALLVVFTLLPVLPLTLTLFSLEDLIKRLLTVVF